VIGRLYRRFTTIVSKSTIGNSRLIAKEYDARISDVSQKAFLHVTPGARNNAVVAEALNTDK
jgi:hypothetical protein